MKAKNRSALGCRNAKHQLNEGLCMEIDLFGHTFNHHYALESRLIEMVEPSYEGVE